jgi:hypothetical protein
MAAKWAFCVEHGMSFDDPSITLSDWKPWLSQQAWYDHAAPLEDQYPQAIQRLLRPRESRRILPAGACVRDTPEHRLRGSGGYVVAMVGPSLSVARLCQVGLGWVGWSGFCAGSIKVSEK